jgi:hypothetical protein
MAEVTVILAGIEQGDPRAASQLLPLVYDELRRLAAPKLAHEKPGQTLEPTALVHQAYLRLVGKDTEAHWDSRGHFFAAAAVAHDHVVAIHAVEEAGPVPYLVMHYVAGISLEDRIKQGGPLELKEILRIGLQAPCGLVTVPEAPLSPEAGERGASGTVTNTGTWRSLLFPVVFAGFFHPLWGCASQAGRSGPRIGWHRNTCATALFPFNPPAGHADTLYIPTINPLWLR